MSQEPRVLIVDDDPLVGRLIGRSLVGYAAVRTEFAVTEPDVIDWEGFDLVILDYNLPVRNGLDILEEIRGVRSDLPVIFLTGFGEPGLAEKALQLGSNLFLTKPVGPKRIRNVFQQFFPDMDENATAPILLEEDAPTADRGFKAKIGEKEEIFGTVSRFGYRSAFVEFTLPCAVSEGDEVADIRFRFGDQMISSGEGRVGGAVLTSPTSVETEIGIRGSWHADVLDRGDQGELRGGDISDHTKGNTSVELKEEWSFLSADYRLAVHDLGEVLNAVFNEASAFETSVEKEDNSVEKLRRDTNFVENTASLYGEIFWSAVERFEKAALQVTDTDMQVLAKEFARRILYPYTLSSPFLSRVVERPIGVPGDYGMLGQILGNPQEGFTIYDRIVNSWILSCGAASAYRYRVSLLHREIVDTVRECANEQRTTKILSMASGVAYEIQRFIQNPPGMGEVEFTMVDFSALTLDEAKRQYANLGRYPAGISVRMEHSSVIELANRSRQGTGASVPDDGFVPEMDYDLVYCAGLFDYLSDRLIASVVAYLFSLLRPGGKVVISNFSTKNPIRSWMTYVMDWKLIYRSEEGFTELIRNAVPAGKIQIETDEDGVEVYAVVRK